MFQFFLRLMFIFQKIQIQNISVEKFIKLAHFSLNVLLSNLRALDVVLCIINPSKGMVYDRKDCVRADLISRESTLYRVTEKI